VGAGAAQGGGALLLLAHVPEVNEDP
jgi:hypothetical protein